VSSDSLHVLEFELAPGGGFRHSPSNRTVFAADVAYCVRAGTLVIADPEHGEVQVVETGEIVLFRRDTWHHGFNPSQQPVRVLEFFAPPPSRGTASVYARQQPMLDSTRYHDESWDTRWPAARADYELLSRLRVLRDRDVLWSLAQQSPGHLLGRLVDTEHLLVQTGRVAAGHLEDFRVVDDESMLVVTDGELWVDARTDDDAPRAACLHPGDAVWLPRGSQLRVLVRAGSPATYLMGGGRPVADGWIP
jgi:quercetin dioxygenase-like cupin family protein